MVEYRIVRDDNGHGWFCGADRLDYFRELAALGGYTITITKTDAATVAQIYRGI